jgi:hypothetical protein
MNIAPTTLLYISEAALAVLAFLCVLAYLKCKDIGYPIMAAVLTAGSVTSYFLASWWGMAVSALVFLALLILGAGLFKRDCERR